MSSGLRMAFRERRTLMLAALHTLALWLSITCAAAAAVGAALPALEWALSFFSLAGRPFATAPLFAEWLRPLSLAGLSFSAAILALLLWLCWLWSASRALLGAQGGAPPLLPGMGELSRLLLTAAAGWGLSLLAVLLAGGSLAAALYFAVGFVARGEGVALPAAAVAAALFMACAVSLGLRPFLAFSLLSTAEETKGVREHLGRGAASLMRTFPRAVSLSVAFRSVRGWFYLSLLAGIVAVLLGESIGLLSPALYLAVGLCAAAAVAGLLRSGEFFAFGALERSLERPPSIQGPSSQGAPGATAPMATTLLSR